MATIKTIMQERLELTNIECNEQLTVMFLEKTKCIP